jgi:hypothetical protein
MIIKNYVKNIIVDMKVMSNKWRFVSYYLWTSATYGFIRGWKAEYAYNQYNTENPIQPVRYNLQTERIAEKMIRAFLNASMYGTFWNPLAVYRLMSRIEIAVTQKDPYNHIYAYNEFINYTTLPPRASDPSTL